MNAVPGEAGNLVVAWFDPGITTGWALVRVPVKRLMENGQVQSIRWTQWKCGQYNFAGDTSASVDRALEIARTAYVEVCEAGDVFVLGSEGFTLRMLSMDAALLEPVRFNSIIDDRLRGNEGGLWCERQQPSDAKKTITDQRLRNWSTWHPSDHARDGLRHAFLFLRRWCSQPALRSAYEGREIQD